MFASRDERIDYCKQSRDYSSPDSGTEQSSWDSSDDAESGANLDSHEINQCQIDDRTLWAETSLPKTSSVNKQLDTSVRIRIPKKYRRMKLRTHDDILQEQYDALRKLLDDKKNLSRKQLREEHVSQTLNMIGKYNHYLSSRDCCCCLPIYPLFSHAQALC